MFLKVFTIICFISFSESCSYMDELLRKSRLEHKTLVKLKYELYNTDHLFVSGEQPVVADNTPFSKADISFFDNSEILLHAAQLYSELYISNASRIAPSNNERISIVNSLTKCVSEKDRCRQYDRVCDSTAIYRIIDGFCNHVKNPIVGMTNGPLIRLTEAVYDDGLHSVRKNSVTNEELQSPRRILNNLNFTEQIPIANITNFGSIVFGQYVAHDLGLRVYAQSARGGFDISCCSSDYSHKLPASLLNQECLPIELPADDPFFSPLNMTCMNFLRSQPAFPNNCKMGPAEIANGVTQYLDKSNVYGNDQATANSLRTYKFGKLKISRDNILAVKSDCTENCYFAGDSRSIQHPTIAVILSLFTRLHNLLADKLAVVNPQWTDEILYQEARKISIAIYSHIIYDEWIPLYIGREYSEELGLTCSNGGSYCGEYNSELEPGSLHEFAHGVYRVFHKFVMPNVDLYNSDMQIYKTYNLSDVIGMSRLVTSESYDGFILGMLNEYSFLGAHNYEMSNKVFKINNPFQVGKDILSHDVQRGRDHGIAPYYVLLKKCVPTSKPVNDWADLEITINPEYIEQLKQSYDNVHDVDLFVGLMAEKKNAGYFGAVGKCLLRQQFYITKFADRFFYSFQKSANPFSEAQLREINNYDYENLICENTDIESIFEKAFLIPSNENKLIDCKQMHKFNATSWLVLEYSSSNSEYVI